MKAYLQFTGAGGGDWDSVLIGQHGVGVDMTFQVTTQKTVAIM